MTTRRRPSESGLQLQTVDEISIFDISLFCQRKVMNSSLLVANHISRFSLSRNHARLLCAIRSFSRRSLDSPAMASTSNPNVNQFDTLSANDHKRGMVSMVRKHPTKNAGDPKAFVEQCLQNCQDRVSAAQTPLHCGASEIASCECHVILASKTPMFHDSACCRSSYSPRAGAPTLRTPRRFWRIPE